jgi:hypothetical protein
MLADCLINSIPETPKWKLSAAFSNHDFDFNRFGDDNIGLSETEQAEKMMAQLSTD